MTLSTGTALAKTVTASPGLFGFCNNLQEVISLQEVILTQISLPIAGFTLSPIFQKFRTNPKLRCMEEEDDDDEETGVERLRIKVGFVQRL